MSRKKLTATEQALVKIQKDLTEYYTQKIYEHTHPNSFLVQEIKKQKVFFSQAKLQKISLKELQSQILKHPIVVMGDYHPFKPSQNEFFDMVRAYDHRDKPCVVILESLLASSQKDLQNFLDGLITAGEFLEDVEFHRYWGFQTYSTEKMMYFCRRENIPLYGMNLMNLSLKTKPQELFKKREESFIATLLNVLCTHPHAKIFVLAGNLHLMPHNLPKYWMEMGKAPILYIHQDIDEVYWRRSITLPHIHRECFSIIPHHTVILNSHPWIKYHSFWHQIEKSIEYEALSPEEAKEDVLMDQYEQFTQLFATICQLLQVKLDPPDFAIYGSLDLSLPLLIKKSKRLTQQEKMFYQFRFKSETGFYLPHEEVLYCPQMSMNMMIDVVTQTVVINARRWHHYFRGKLADFYSWMVFEALIFFISKLLNSSRKPPSFTKLFEGQSRFLFGESFQCQYEEVLKNQTGDAWTPLEEIFLSLPDDKKYLLVQWLGRNWGQAWFHHHTEVGNDKILDFFPSTAPHDLLSAKRTFKSLLKKIPFEL